MARRPARLDPATREHADVVEADLRDTAAVVQASRDAEALFWLEPQAADPDADPVAWYSMLGANAARAVTENGIGRTVFLSSIGAEMRSGAGGDRWAGSDRGAARRHWRDGAAPALRVLLHQLARGARFDARRRAARADGARLRAAMGRPARHRRIATARLLSEGWSGRQVQAVHGSEDLTLAQVAQIIGEATGRRVRAETISQDALRASLRSAGTRRQAGRGHGRDVGGNARGLRGRG